MNNYNELLINLPKIHTTELGYKRIKNNLNIVKSKCPADGHTNRESTKQFISEMDKTNKGFSDRIFGAMRRANIDGWGGIDWIPNEKK